MEIEGLEAQSGRTATAGLGRARPEAGRGLARAWGTTGPGEGQLFAAWGCPIPSTPGLHPTNASRNRPETARTFPKASSGTRPPSAGSAQAEKTATAGTCCLRH